MMKRYSKFFKVLHFIGDVFILNVAIILAFHTRFSDTVDIPFVARDKYLVLYMVFNIVWVLTALIFRIYELYRVVSVEKVIKNLIKAIGLHLLLIAIFIVMLKWYHFSREFLFYTYLYFSLLVVISRTAFLIFIGHIRSAGINTRTAIIIGSGPTALKTYNLLADHSEYGFDFLGFFTDDEFEEENGKKLLGRISDLARFEENNKIDEIFCTIPLAQTDKIRNLMNFADNKMIRFKLVPDFRGFYNQKMALEFYEDLPVLLRRAEPLQNAFNSAVKRFFDIMFSLTVILFILSWVTPLLAILIRINSRGPVFFRQKRSGKVNQVFNCWKFRTMYVNEDSDQVQAKEGDPRITSFGQFLRRTSLDELPQFFNVLMGDMSVVGPRPHMLKHTEEYSKEIDKFMVRHLVTPGITGLAQVRGYRGETSSESDLMYRRVKTDVWYIENWSFLLDIQIIFLTIRNGLVGDKMAA